MSSHDRKSPAEIRANLKHPVIDGDGHWVEYDPVFAEQMRKVGGDKAADGFLASMSATKTALNMSVEERKRRRIAMPGFWGRQTSNTMDRATAMMPRMLYDRLDEFGTDFAIIYPDGNNSTDSFQGYVVNFTITGQIGKVFEASIEIVNGGSAPSLV